MRFLDLVGTLMTITTTTAQLQELARRIAQQEAALAKLRGRLDARLGKLHRRREDLRAKLRDVEAEIEAASPADRPTEQITPMPTDTPKAETPPAQRRARSGSTLPQLLIELVREGNGRPVPIAVLKAETVRRGFPSTSSDIPAMVQARASELVRRGLLRRDRARRGYLLPKETNGSEEPASKHRARRKTVRKPTAQARSSRGTGTGTGQPSLRSVLVSILKKTGRTMSVEELANQAQRAGYRSRSKAFKNVIWVTVSNMPEIEHDPKGGYRLKKGRG
jgi:hypothetical protein